MAVAVEIVETELDVGLDLVGVVLYVYWVLFLNLVEIRALLLRLDRWTLV